jgi:hypothetical protein
MSRTLFGIICALVSLSVLMLAGCGQNSPGSGQAANINFITYCLSKHITASG